MSSPINVTEATFEEEVINSDIPVLVDFWATWCGPCKALAPTLEDLAQEYDGKAKIVKIDIDSNQAIAGKFGIRSIPTLFVFKNGEKVDGIVGQKPKGELIQLLDKHL